VSAQSQAIVIKVGTLKVDTSTATIRDLQRAIAGVREGFYELKPAEAGADLNARDRQGAGAEAEPRPQQERPAARVQEPADWLGPAPIQL
jgi:hypothetical protein